VSITTVHFSYLNGNRLLPSKFQSTSGKSDSDDLSNPNTGIPLSQAMVNIGFPISSEATLLASSKAVKALATKVRGIRMIASASQVLAWVAQGKLNAYVSWDLNAWDIAAGILLVEESGGRCYNFDGSLADVSCRDLIATSWEGKDGVHSLSESLKEVLEENDCLKY
jgi:myo-inositol-1(or 4)-monophosphatase